MAVSTRFTGAVTNNGVPVEGTVTVVTTSSPAGASAPLSVAGRFSVRVNAAAGDTVTLTVDDGTKFTATVVLPQVLANYPADLSCDIGSGSISLLRVL